MNFIHILIYLNRFFFIYFQAPSRPEFKFYSSSPVLCARFHTQDPHLVVGGCYSGKLELIHKLKLLFMILYYFIVYIILHSIV